jgi:hypothetical protein
MTKSAETGLELRKALCVALGWKFVRFMKGCSRLPSGYCGIDPSTGREDWLPALESDPAAFWPEFEKWRTEKNLNYEIGSDSRGSSLAAGDEPLERLFYCKILDDAFNEILREEGETQLEASCRVWFAALEALHSLDTPKKEK